MKYDYEILYHMLDSDASFEEKIEFLKTTPMDISLEGQPDALIQRFYNDFDSDEKIFQLRNILKKRFGSIIVCREASCCESKFLMIEDCIQNDIEYFPDFQNNLQRYLELVGSLNFERNDHNIIKSMASEYCRSNAYKEDLLIDIPEYTIMIKEHKLPYRNTLIQKVYEKHMEILLKKYNISDDYWDMIMSYL